MKLYRASGQMCECHWQQLAQACPEQQVPPNVPLRVSPLQAFTQALCLIQCPSIKVGATHHSHHYTNSK